MASSLAERNNPYVIKHVDSAGNIAVAGVSFGFTASVTFTRPADINAYTANDVVGATAAALEFTNSGASGGAIIINSAELEIDINAVPAGMTTHTLHLYGVTPPSALADSAAFDLPAGDRASYLGSLALGTPVDLGSTLYVRTNNIDAQFRLTGTSLFGYLVTVGGYTPASAVVSKITLHATAV